MSVTESTRGYEFPSSKELREVLASAYSDKFTRRECHAISKILGGRTYTSLQLHVIAAQIKPEISKQLAALTMQLYEVAMDLQRLSCNPNVGHLTPGACSYDYSRSDAEESEADATLTDRSGEEEESEFSRSGYASNAAQESCEEVLSLSDSSSAKTHSPSASGTSFVSLPPLPLPTNSSRSSRGGESSGGVVSARCVKLRTIESESEESSYESLSTFNKEVERYAKTLMDFSPDLTPDEAWRSARESRIATLASRLMQTHRGIDFDEAVKEVRERYEELASSHSYTYEEECSYSTETSEE